MQETYRANQRYRTDVFFPLVVGKQADFFCRHNTLAEGTSQSASRSTQCLPGLFRLDPINNDFDLLQFRNVKDRQYGGRLPITIAGHEVVVRPGLGTVVGGHDEIQEYIEGLQKKSVNARYDRCGINTYENKRAMPVKVKIQKSMTGGTHVQGVSNLF